MMKDLASVLACSRMALLQDAVGLVALLVMLFVGLHLPLIA
ncbi:MAG: hypothetical protein ACWA5A_05315 [Marinibacterium sp.]